jgi:hypothetical protein
MLRLIQLSFLLYYFKCRQTFSTWVGNHQVNIYTRKLQNVDAYNTVFARVICAPAYFAHLNF